MRDGVGAAAVLRPGERRVQARRRGGERLLRPDELRGERVVGLLPLPGLRGVVRGRGLLHGAGVRGRALRGVLESTVAAMEGLGAGRERIVAVIGPTISADAYEVGPEFVARFLEEDEGSAPFFVRAERAGHSMFDLPGYVAMRLGKAGLGGVEDLGLCTYHDEARFFSYRRMTHRGEPDYGRLVAGIALAG